MRLMPTALGSSSIKDIDLVDMRAAFEVLKRLGQSGDLYNGCAGIFFEASKNIALLILERENA